MNKKALTYLKVATISIGAGSLLALIIKRKEIMKAIWDHYTTSRISQLHPAIREKAKRFIAEAQEKGIFLRVTSGLRTFKQQAELYTKGRTEAGNIVTNAKPGSSYHNYGLALDVVEMVDGEPIWNNPRWNQIAAIGAKYGFEWGGNFKTITDKPHFQISFGYKTRQLLTIYSSGQLDKNGYVKLA